MIKVYRYGLLPAIDGADRVRDQMRAAHRYYNQLVEIERNRRKSIVGILESHQSTEVLARRVQEDLHALESARAELPKKWKNEDVAHKESRKRACEIRARLKESRGALREAKRSLRGDEFVQQKLAEINVDCKIQHKRARAECGVYWGTYLIIEQAMDAARKSFTPPRFRAWRGDGTIAVELIHGLHVQKLLACEDRRLILDPLPQAVPRRSGKPRPRISLRVGSLGRDPIWATWPLIMHRPLPADAVIKWARVKCEYIGTDERWSLSLTLETAKQREQCGSGVVAVDLGWRRNGRIRVGEWRAHDGNGADIEIHSRIESAFDRAESLRGIRDRHTNRLRRWLVRLRGMAAGEHAERLSRIGSWKSSRRFAALAFWWRRNRFEGDGRIAGVLAAWLRRESHLWREEAHLRKSAINRRRDDFRVLSATLARRYDTLVLERIDLRKLAETPHPESEREPAMGQRQRMIAAPSDLRTALEQAFSARGGSIATVQAGLGSAKDMLDAFFERRGVEQKPVISRMSKFKRIAEKKKGGEIVATTR